MRLLVFSTLLITTLLAFSVAPAFAATCVKVKDGASVPLGAFSCVDTLDNRLINKVCYDTNRQYMLVRLRTTYYHYCGVDVPAVEGLLQAKLKGKHYTQNIKGKYNCTAAPVYAEACAK